MACTSAWTAAKVRGFDVYRSVLDDQVRTQEQFDQWRARQAKS
jgi:hypothetical protein